MQNRSRFELRLAVAFLLFIILISPAALSLLGLSNSRRGIIVVTGAAASSSNPTVVVVELNVQIDQGSSGLMSRAVSTAEAEGASAIIINMNTPGGILQDMILMVDSITNSTVPVYTYVGNDSTAASAGSYIAMATKEIFMGPGSQIGPSEPYIIGGTDLEQNHTAEAMLSFMQSLAQEHGRNVTAATQMVAYDIAYSASDALKYHVADASSNSLSQTLQDLNLGGASIVTVSESVTEQLVSFLSNPIVDGILLLVGIVAIVIDFLHPTIILSIAGAVLIALGIIGAEAIDTGASASIIAVPLILFAAAATLIILELKTGHGFMILAGIIVGAVATVLLVYEIPYSPSPLGTLQYVELAILVALGVVFALYARWIGSSLRKKPVTGAESMIGREGVVTTELAPIGEVFLDGIYWRARVRPSATGTETRRIEKGTIVKILGISDLTLDVEPEPIKQNAQA